MIFRPFLALVLLSSGLCSCGSSSDRPTEAIAQAPQSPSSDLGGAPVALAPKRATSQSIAMAVNQDELVKAIERYRIAKKKGDTPFEQAGADLNGDGRPEALTLITGPDWCSPQGCTLVVFQPSEFGLRPVCQIVGVKAPIAAGPGTNAGWHDLIVKTGQSKIVRLQFTGGGYPANAAGQPDASSEVPQVEVLIAPQGPSTAQTATAAGTAQAQ